MTTPAHFAYGNRDPGQLPTVSLRISYLGSSHVVTALVDSGASLNVLPFEIGVQVGLDWNRQAIDPFSPVLLAFAWTKAQGVPVILGQQNFFMEFDVCFYRSQCRFEIKPKKRHSRMESNEAHPSGT